MNTTNFNIYNVDCASCASKIEKAVNGIKDIESADLNLATSTLKITSLKPFNTEDLIRNLSNTISNVEPGVEIQSKSNNTEKTGKQKNTGKLIFLIATAVIYFAGLFFEEWFFSIANGIPAFAGFGLLYIIMGWPVIYKAVRNILKGDFFDENFLMTIATVGAFFINAIPEAVGVMLFYRFGEYFEDLAVNRSRRSIQSLVELRPDTAHLVTSGNTSDVHPSELNPDDVILVKPGERVPVDGILISESAFVDTSAITGESVPRSIDTGEEITSGFIVQNSAARVKVQKRFEDSSISRILHLVEEAANAKAPTEKFITRFAKIYTPIVVFTALAIALIPSLVLNLGTLSEWTYKALVLLVVSCPCALVISVPLSYFGGIGAASRKGILIKGSNYMDAINSIRTVIFDKTGTLTQGKLEVDHLEAEDNFSKDQILEYAAYGEAHSNHPLALAVTNYYTTLSGKEIDESRIGSHKDIAGHGIIVEVDGKTIHLGNKKLMHKENIIFNNSHVNETVIYVAINKEYAGHIAVKDQIREDAVEALSALKNYGVDNLVMLTGDNKEVAQDIGKQLGINHIEAELLPEQKLDITQKYIDEQKKGSVAVVGDGINDAAMIAKADVGFAMGGIGSDLAIESADIVLMNDKLASIPEAMKIGKKTKTLVWQNIIFALGVKILVMTLGIVGVSGLWEAIFADVGVTLLAILNSIRLIKSN